MIAPTSTKEASGTGRAATGSADRAGSRCPSVLLPGALMLAGGAAWFATPGLQRPSAQCHERNFSVDSTQAGRYMSEDEIKARSFGQRLSTDRLSLKVPSNSKSAVLIVACGSFSPPTLAHFRILEDARDCLQAQGIHVVGGIMSPVHAKYGKKSLAAMHHRLNMVQEGLADSDWLSCDAWECAQDEWTRTAHVISRIQSELDLLYQEGRLSQPARAALLGGADLVESFAEIRPNGEPVWSPEDVEEIVSRGVVCITRDGFDLEDIIRRQPILAKHRNSIHMVSVSVENNISSTLLRKTLVGGGSIKYLTLEPVRQYILEHNLRELPQWR